MDNSIVYGTDPVVLIRERRVKECFSVINRGKLWYDRLTYEQLADLKRWYQEWLDAPETLMTPVYPTWLNDKLAEEEILI